MIHRSLFAFAITLALLLSSCRTQTYLHEPIPDKPNYKDTTQWYVNERQADADLFYIISTETSDYLMSDGQTCHYADTHADSLRKPLYGEMTGVDRLLSGELNYYSPYYRQCSLQSFVSDSLMTARMALPMSDIRRAFKHYMKYRNNGRPFILAGFSQGAFLMVELLKEMDEKTFRRMIAAYAIGITIPETDRHIIPAQGADDTGVTVCYNSVRDTSCAMKGWKKSSIAINPVNWRTDSTQATLITEPSPNMTVNKQEKDTMTVALDNATSLLIVKGYTAQDYILPLIGIEGNYHSREIWLYRNHLRANIALRTAKYLQTKQHLRTK